MYLGGVKVHIIILLIRGQILMAVVRGSPDQHHPVAVLLTAGVKTHHCAIFLKDLYNKKNVCLHLR